MKPHCGAMDRRSRLLCGSSTFDVKPKESEIFSRTSAHFECGIAMCLTARPFPKPTTKHFPPSSLHRFLLKILWVSSFQFSSFSSTTSLTSQNHGRFSVNPIPQSTLPKPAAPFYLYTLSSMVSFTLSNKPTVLLSVSLSKNILQILSVRDNLLLTFYS